jgi:hypothetical protein
VQRRRFSAIPRTHNQTGVTAAGSNADKKVNWSLEHST